MVQLRGARRCGGNTYWRSYKYPGWHNNTVTRNGHPTIIGNGVTVGHKTVLHACRLEDSSFIGMGAVIMDDVVVESGAMVAAGALVPPRKIVKSGQIWAGSPAKYFRDLTPEESAFIKKSEENYVKHVEEYLGF